MQQEIIVDNSDFNGKKKFLSISAWITVLRPAQWTKNLIVLASFFFAYWDQSKNQPLTTANLLTSLFAVIIFCGTSSGIYLLNDIKDLSADRIHPLKRFRPIAAGIISIPSALIVSGLLIGINGIISAFLSIRFTVLLMVYVILQMFYTFWLKRLPIVDITIIATGFVIRAISGAVVLNITISPWLLLCTFLLAIFLGLCKRRHEKLLLREIGANHRAVLVLYDNKVLDQLISICSSSVIVCYAIYTLWPDTVHKFGTSAMVYTVPVSYTHLTLPTIYSV